MKQKLVRSRILWLLAVALATSLASPVEAQPSGLYVVFGRVFGVQESSTAVTSTATSAIPGATPAEPDPIQPVPAGTRRRNSKVPLPGVTIEAYEKDSGNLLGQGNANREGFFRVEYNRVVANHQVVFRVFWNSAEGGREFVGESEPILVNQQLFGFELEVPVAGSVRAGTPEFSTAGQFVFIEVGDVDVNNIYDEQQDPAVSNQWGLTKQTATGGFDSPFNGHRLGPELAFGGTLELYGLFEPTSSARYYRINYSGPDAGSIQTPLDKKNFVFAGSGVETHIVRLGPQTVGGESNLYRLDEFLEGEMIPGSSPPRNFSSFWTEVGLRALWDTGGLPDGLYTLSVQAFDATGAPVPAPASLNNYATLNLHLVNTPPVARIHSLHYLPPSEEPPVLSDANPCQSVVLNRVSAPTFDDTLQFKLTARHPGGFLKDYQLTALHGHDTPDGVITEDTHALSFPLGPAGPDSQLFETPGSIHYQSCAYRFRLQVTPRITNGYHIIYIQEDNWYVAIQVVTPP